MRRLVAVTALLAFAGCGTSGRITDLADRVGCENERETGDIDMQGTGLVGTCDGIPEGGAALLLTFGSQDDRDRFFTEIWPSTDFCGSSALVGDDWAVAVDDGIEKTAAVQQRVGGIALPEAGTGFGRCD